MHLEDVHSRDLRPTGYWYWLTLEKFRTLALKDTNVILLLRNSYISCCCHLSGRM